MLYYLTAHENGLTQYDQCSCADITNTEIILTGGGCGLNSALQNVFEKENKTLCSYPGQAISYPVIEEWVSLGIANAILPKTKITQSNYSMYPLYSEDNHHEQFTYKWVWNAETYKDAHIEEFQRHISQVVPSLISGLNQ